MPDSIRIKEIHEYVQQYKSVLGSDEHQTQTNGVNNPINLWYFVQRIARVLGISVNEDRTVRAIRQRATIPHGKPVPLGWNFGQWGTNEGEDYQKGTDPSQPAIGVRDGIALQGIPNKFVIDPFDRRKFKIAPGDTVLCENLPQLYSELMDQIDKAFGMQEAAAFMLPNADGSGKILRTEGMLQLLAEIAFAASKISENTARTEISSETTQAIVKEILQGLGLPVTAKTLPVKVAHGVAQVPYPGLASDAPSLLLLSMEILKHVGTLIGQEVKK